MSFRSRWNNGSWNVICDQCGRKFKEEDLRIRWDGLMVCSEDWETRQPQDFVHGVADTQAPPFARPEQQNVFQSLVCNLLTIQGASEYGVADCAQADLNNGYTPTNYPSF